MFKFSPHHHHHHHHVIVTSNIISLFLGHRDPITALALHPTFSLIASASEDSTVKLWDFESGEFERTLKGHTNTVQHLTFDRAGALTRDEKRREVGNQKHNRGGWCLWFEHTNFSFCFVLVR